MSKEVMQQALEALVLNNAEWKSLADSGDSGYWKAEDQDHYQQTNKAITALETELAKPDFWEGYVPEPDSTCSNALRIQHKAYPRTCKKCGLGPCIALANKALDKKAENARELGLDYEPVCNKDPQGCWNVRCQLGKKCKNTPAQRTWVGLEKSDMPDGADPLFDDPKFIAGMVYAANKLMEKNNG